MLWTFTQRSVIRQVVKEFDHWIYKNHFRFKKDFNIASTTDGNIHFYLNYHSVGIFDHVLLIITNKNAHIHVIS